MDCRVKGLVILVESKALAPGELNSTAKPLNLFFHLGMLGPLADALEVGLDLALEFEPVAARATLERLLDDIAAQL